MIWFSTRHTDCRNVLIANLQYSGITVSINRLPSTVSAEQARSWPAQLTLKVIDLW